MAVQDGVPAKLKVKCSISKMITDEIESRLYAPDQITLL